MGMHGVFFMLAWFIYVPLNAFAVERFEFLLDTIPMTTPYTVEMDWSQPPVACVEEMTPEKGNRPCLDLSKVPNPQIDWPSSLPPEELKYWQSKKRPIQYCRAQEILRREKLRPGTFSSGVIEVSWMQVLAVEHSEAKIVAIYSASRKHQIPAQVLSGALFQESMFAELGIAEDGANYSCGIGQINIMEWCRWANLQTSEIKRAIRWPETAVNCRNFEPTLIKPFYDIAKTRLNSAPEYKLLKEHFQNISLQDVINGFPAGELELQQLRFALARSFIDNCSESQFGIAAKAQELANLYQAFVPEGLKKRELYPEGQEFQRKCVDRGYTKAYPLHSGWLLAVGTYNAGPRAVDSLAYYQQLSREQIRDPNVWNGFTPKQMVENLYWSGKYDGRDDKIHFSTFGGQDTSWIWFKPCVLQRHIARVAQHVTLPGIPYFLDTLEGNFRCAKSQFDPNTGELIKSAVPPHRQVSSGVKPASSELKQGIH